MANWKAALRMTLDNTGVVKGLREHERASKGATSATEHLRDANGRFIAGAGKLDSVTAKFRSLGSAAGAAGTAMGKAASGGGGMGWANIAGAVSVAGVALQGVQAAAGGVASIFRSGMNMENLVRQLAASTEDTESLRFQMDELAKVGAKPGIDFNTAIQGSAALQSVGMSAKQSRNALEQWSNVVASAGGNAETLQGVLMAVRQMMTKDTIQQEDVNQILERVPQFATINAQLEKLKVNPKAYMAAAIEELGKMDRVASGTQEAVDGLMDSWEQFKVKLSGEGVKAIGVGAMNFGSRVLQGQWGEAFSKLGSDVKGASRDPIDSLGPSLEQVTKRQLARQDAEKKKIEEKVKAGEKYFNLAEENAKKTFDLQAEELRFEQEIQALRSVGREEDAQKLEDHRTLMQQVKKLAADLNVQESLVRDRLKEQLDLRRETERIAGQKQARETAEDQRIQGLRNAGRDREADRADDDRVRKQTLERLKGQKVPAAEAERLADEEVRQRRDARNIERTGRRGIRGAKARGYQGLDDYDRFGDEPLGFTPRLLDLDPKGGIGNGRRADRMAGIPAAQNRAAKAGAAAGLDDETKGLLKRADKRLGEIADGIKNLDRKENPPR